MDEQVWTIGKLLTWTADFLRQKGAESPRLDAEVLLAHARGCSRIALYTAYEEPADEALRTRFRDLVKQRAAGMPVAYLVGQREFFSLPFEVTPDVLIPRPETESLVVRAIDLVREGGLPTDGEAVRIADVGTGSGALAVCLARHLPAARLWAIDVSQPALEVARRNAARHAVEQRITWLHGDLFAAADPALLWHLVVSNPPYVTTDELSQLAADVRKYEPRVALDGGPTGVAVIERLLQQAPQRLVPGGRLLLEIGPGVAARVAALVRATPSLELVEIRRDLAGHERIVELLRSESPP